MQPQQMAPSRGGRARTNVRDGGRSELDRLRGICRRQAGVIDRLGGAVGVLRGGAMALKAENVELRAENDRLRRPARVDDGDAVEVELPLDLRAPGAARIVIQECLGERVEPDVLATAQLLVTELVTNSVRHSGTAVADGVVVRLARSHDVVTIEVRDRGGGRGAPAVVDPERSGGFGLKLVQDLSERWGLERVGGAQTRVWAQLRCDPVTASALGEHGESR